MHFTQHIFLINILNAFNRGFFFHSTFKYKLCKDSFLKHIIHFLELVLRIRTLNGIIQVKSIGIGTSSHLHGFPGGSAIKNPPAMQKMQETWVHPLVEKIPWRRACQPPPVTLPGESHRQRSLEGYSPRDHKEWDTTETTEHSHLHIFQPHPQPVVNTDHLCICELIFITRLIVVIISQYVKISTSMIYT